MADEAQILAMCLYHRTASPPPATSKKKQQPKKVEEPIGEIDITFGPNLQRRLGWVKLVEPKNAPYPVLIRDIRLCENSLDAADWDDGFRASSHLTAAELKGGKKETTTATKNKKNKKKSTTSSATENEKKYIQCMMLTDEMQKVLFDTYIFGDGTPETLLENSKKLMTKEGVDGKKQNQKLITAPKVMGVAASTTPKKLTTSVQTKKTGGKVEKKSSGSQQQQRKKTAKKAAKKKSTSTGRKKSVVKKKPATKGKKGGKKQMKKPKAPARKIAKKTPQKAKGKKAKK